MDASQGLEYYPSVGNTEEDNGDENLTTRDTWKEIPAMMGEVKVTSVINIKEK